MTKVDFKPIFSSITEVEQTRFLSLVAHNLTICARSASLPEVQDAKARKKFHGINELLHTISSQILHIVSDNKNRCSDIVFVDILLEKAEKLFCEYDLFEALDWSLSSLRVRNKTNL